MCVSSPTIKDKPVQIRPWRLSDADFVLDASMPLDPRKTVFVGGVPRPLKAGKLPIAAAPFPRINDFHIAISSALVELAMIMDRLYGGVCYAGIDTDPELKYPKASQASNQRITVYCDSITLDNLILGRRQSRVLQSAELHCGHLGPIRAVATWRYRQAGRSETVRSG